MCAEPGKRNSQVSAKRAQLCFGEWVWSGQGFPATEREGAGVIEKPLPSEIMRQPSSSSSFSLIPRFLVIPSGQSLQSSASSNIGSFRDLNEIQGVSTGRQNMGVKEMLLKEGESSLPSSQVMCDLRQYTHAKYRVSHRL